MSLISIKRDFFVKAGIAVLGTNEVNSSTGSTSSLQVNGGASIAKNIIVGTSATIHGVFTALGDSYFNVTTASQLTVTGSSSLEDLIVENSTATQLTVTGNTLLGPLTASIITSTMLTVSGQSTLGEITAGITTATSLTVGSITADNIVSIITTSNSTSTITGALQVAGGAGIGGNLYVGGILNVIDTINGTSRSANNLEGGATGSIPYQTNIGTTAFIPIGTSGFLFQSNGTTATWISTGSLVAGIASTASNINGGSQYQIPYQTNSGSTAFDEGLTYNYISDTLQTVNAIFSSTSTAGTTTTGALVVAGGVGIGNNLVVGGSSTITNNLILGGNLSVNGGNITSGASTFNLLASNITTANILNSSTAITIGELTGYTEVRNQFTVSNVTAASSTLTGALQVRGGIGIGGSIFVGNTASILNTAASTGSLQSNALYVAGGVGIAKSLYVTGEAVFSNNVVFSGTTTYVYSTVTVYTDNLLELHAPSNNTWSVDDGKDIGIVFNYYNNSDQNGFLGLANDTKYLEWYNSGVEHSTSSIFTSATYGTFKTGSIKLQNTTTSIGTNTGALTVVGGVGIGENLYVGGLTSFNGLSKITNISESTSTNTGALTVVGGVGIGGNLYVGGNAAATELIITGRSTLGEINASITTATALTVTGIASFTDSTNAVATNDGAIKVSGGVGVAQDVYVGGLITAGATASATTANVVSGVFYNNTLLASYTSNPIATLSEQTLDIFSGASYRSAKYFCQVVAGTRIQVSEISVFHDNTSAYISEYGVSSNTGFLGNFNATYTSGNIAVTWTANTTTSMVIKLTRLTITA